MFSPRFLVAAAIAASAGCAVTPAGPPASSPAAPERSVQATSPARMPTLEEMKKLVPGRLTAAEAAKVLVRVPQNKIYLPKERKTQLLSTYGFGWGGLGLGLGLGISPFYASILANPIGSIYGFYPFGWGGADFWAPFLYNPLALAYTPFLGLSTIISTYPYFASPFIGSLGCGLAPYAFASTISTLGCAGIGTGLIL